MKKFRRGSCRDMEPWPWKPTINFMKTAAKPRLMYLSRLVSDPLPVLFRDILRTAIPRPRRKWPTIMAGLACGEPNTISWDILKNHVDTFVAAPDWVAAKGMRMLAAPIKGDTPVTSGESGAAPFGTLACIMCMDEYQELREHLGLDETSRVLLFSTEGDTDPARYESIVWDGNER